MNINPISNKNKPNFNAKFRSSEALTKSLERASDYDLKEFSDLLRRMKMKGDDVVFQIRTSFFDNGISNDVELLESFKNTLRSHKVGLKFINSEKDLSSSFYNVIKNVNKILEPMYPKPEITGVKRETSLKKIFKNLD